MNSLTPPPPATEAPATGDVLLDRCRRMGETANARGLLRLGTAWHERADAIAAGLPGAREEAAAKFAEIAAITEQARIKAGATGEGEGR
jgi:hypothetical protein